MRFKKLTSLLCAAVLTVSSFAGLSLTAGAAGETPAVTFEYVAAGNACKNRASS